MKEGKQSFFSRIWERLRREAQWFRPGLGYKRWLILVFIGIVLLGLGFALIILDIYRNAPDSWWLPALSYLSLRFLDRPIRVFIFGGIGLALTLIGIWGSNRSLLRPFLPPGKSLIEALESYRRRDRGPRVVILGGGHGLASLLRGLKEYTHNITAIVSVADDGGSSGELRKNVGILPPGDIRNCLAALSNNEDLLGQVFQYRFASGTGLEGHSLGNLLITALTEITGSFEEARIRTCSGCVRSGSAVNFNRCASSSRPVKWGWSYPSCLRRDPNSFNRRTCSAVVAGSRQYTSLPTSHFSCFRC